MLSLSLSVCVFLCPEINFFFFTEYQCAAVSVSGVRSRRRRPCSTPPRLVRPIVLVSLSCFLSLSNPSCSHSCRHSPLIFFFLRMVNKLDHWSRHTPLATKVCLGRFTPFDSCPFSVFYYPHYSKSELPNCFESQGIEISRR